MICYVLLGFVEQILRRGGLGGGIGLFLVSRGLNSGITIIFIS